MLLLLRVAGKAMTTEEFPVLVFVVLPNMAPIAIRKALHPVKCAFVALVLLCPDLGVLDLKADPLDGTLPTNS